MDQDIQRLFDERECEKLISEYCRLVDFGNAAGIAQLLFRTAFGLDRMSR